MPCLNEAETLGDVHREGAGRVSSAAASTGEVVIADNGSTDGSQEIADAAGARVVDVADQGYGSALMGGIDAARGRYVIMGDADDSYDFGHLEAVRRAAAGRRRPGDGQPLPRRHRARRDAVRCTATSATRC